jgi:drug/metabolite transporter (DMT)-like permease
MSVILAWLFLRERMGPLKVAGMVLVFVGAYLAFWDGRSIREVASSGDTLAVVAVVISAAFFGVYGLSARVASRREDTMDFLIPVLAISMVVSGGAALFRFEARGPLFPLPFIIILILGLIGTGLGQFLLAEGIKRVSASGAGIMTNLYPLITVLSSHLILGEPISPYILLSAFMIVAGISGVVYSEDRYRRMRTKEIVTE